MKRAFVKEHAASYCAATSIHGLGYIVSASRGYERICWAAVVIAFASYAGFIIAGAIKEWVESPAVTEIKSFSKVEFCLWPFIQSQLFQPVSQVDFPTLTLCNPNGIDTGEYVRAVFNNLDFDKNLAEKFMFGFLRKVQEDIKDFLINWGRLNTKMIFKKLQNEISANFSLMETWISLSP